MHIPNAKSEPRDVDDAAISHLLTLARDYSTQSGSGFTCLARSLADLCESDPKLKTLGEQAQLLMGNGALLQGIFRRLFPAQTYPFAVAHLESKPNLTDREHQVLLELARGRSREQLARRLSVKPGTVKRHIENIYRKLGVESSTEAIAKATALGLADFDLVDIVLPSVDGKNLDLTYFAGMMLSGRVYGTDGAPPDPVRALASAATVLLLLAASLPRNETLDDGSAQYANHRGAILEFSNDGRLLNRFDLGGELRIPYSMAIAPPAAARHGFTPRHLYIVNGGTYPDSLNPHAIAEFTPHGETVRAFSGGAYIGTRLNAYDVAFTADGRLLAACGDCTDAILEFSEGGSRVKRFIDIIPYGGIATDDSGQIYVAGGRWYQNPVHVFGPDGKLLRKVGYSQWTLGDEVPYQGVAVDCSGRVFVANTKTACIEVYNAEGARDGTFRDDVTNGPWRLALDNRGRLFSISGSNEDVRYDPNSCASQVDVLDAKNGVPLRRILAPDGVRFISLCVGPNGTLYAGGLCI